MLGRGKVGGRIGDMRQACMLWRALKSSRMRRPPVFVLHGQLSKHTCIAHLLGLTVTVCGLELPSLREEDIGCGTRPQSHNFQEAESECKPMSKPHMLCSKTHYLKITQFPFPLRNLVIITVMLHAYYLSSVYSYEIITCQ